MCRAPCRKHTRTLLNIGYGAYCCLNQAFVSIGLFLVGRLQAHQLSSSIAAVAKIQHRCPIVLAQAQSYFIESLVPIVG